MIPTRTRSLGVAATAALALGAGMFRQSPAKMRAALQAKENRDEFRRHLITNSKRTPKPEVMFRSLIKEGRAKIVRRRYRSPLLVFTDSASAQ